MSETIPTFAPSESNRNNSPTKSKQKTKRRQSTECLTIIKNKHVMKSDLHTSLSQAIKLMLLVLMCLPVCSTAVKAQSPEAYAVFDSTTGTLTFKYDAAKPEGAYEMNNGYTAPGWYYKANDIKKIVFESSFADARPTSCSHWFGSYHGEEIEGLEYLNTSEVTNMALMFNNLSKFNTGKVTVFQYMFAGCRSLTSLDVSSFNTENATNMAAMFYGSSSLTSLDVSNFNTSNVTTMEDMFRSCGELKSLDLSKFNTSNVKEMNSMFYECGALASLDVSSFNTSNVTTMASMFGRCVALTTLDLSSFNTEKVEKMQYMFYIGTSLTTIYASEKFVTTNVTDSDYMFGWCDALKGAIAYDENKIGQECANCNDGYFTYKEFSSIKPLIDSTNDKPQYFDMQGKRLAKMQRGVNIVRVGGKTVKVVK